MSWFPILAVAALAFLIAATLLKLPRAGYTLLGAALLFGLAGYALQGSPGAPASAGAGELDTQRSSALLVEARRAFFEPQVLPSRYLVTSDAFARRGDALAAAGFANSALADNPNDVEAWIALGNALVDHAAGRMTPAALYAYGEAQRRGPASPAPRYFLGLGWLRGGDPQRAREVWAEVVAGAPSNAPWRPELVAQLARLDQLLGTEASR